MAWDKTKYTEEQLREYYRNYYHSKQKISNAQKKAENPIYRICAMCGTKFEAKRRNQKYCCEACVKLATRIRQKMYNLKGTYKETQKKYRDSEKGKETRRKYLESERGQEVKQKYLQSERAKEIRRKYSQSEKGKEVYRRYYQRRKANGGLPLSQKPENNESNLEK